MKKSLEIYQVVKKFGKASRLVYTHSADGYGSGNERTSSAYFGVFVNGCRRGTARMPISRYEQLGSPEEISVADVVAQFPSAKKKRVMRKTETQVLTVPEFESEYYFDLRSYILRLHEENENGFLCTISKINTGNPLKKHMVSISRELAQRAFEDIRPGSPSYANNLVKAYKNIEKEAKERS